MNKPIRQFYDTMLGEEHLIRIASNSRNGGIDRDKEPFNEMAYSGTLVKRENGMLYFRDVAELVEVGRNEYSETTRKVETKNIPLDDISYITYY